MSISNPSLPAVPDGLHVDELRLDESGLVITARTTATQTACKVCGRPSGRVHSSYWRTIQDLPWQDRAVTWRVRVRRFRCGHCPGRIFAGPVPGLGVRKARRSGRLAAAQTDIGMVLGGEPGARLSRRLAMPVNRLAERAAELTATDAAHALANARKLAAIVDEARGVEQQPFLLGLRQTVDARRHKGQGAIPMPERWRKAGGATSFPCPDAALDQRLAAVADAVAGVKPVPEVDVPDYRDPQVGVPKALQRVLGAIAHLRLLPPSRPEQETDRAKVLNASVEAAGLQKGDLLPLAMATGIEAFLTLTYLFAGASFAQEGAIDQVERRLRNDGRRGVFQRLWRAMGNDAAVFRVFNRHVFWRHSGAYVFVPASDDADAVELRTIMEVAADAGLARRKATGRWLARLYAVGWDRERREAVFGPGLQVRVYGLRHRDVVAILVDAFGAEPEEREVEAEPGPVSWL